MCIKLPNPVIKHGENLIHNPLTEHSKSERESKIMLTTKSLINRMELSQLLSACFV